MEYEVFASRAAIVILAVSFVLAAPALRAQSAAGPVRVSSGLMASALQTRVQPIYPPAARALLQSAAMDAGKQWTYKPYQLNGTPTEVDTTITVNFLLGSPETGTGNTPPAQRAASETGPRSPAPPNSRTVPGIELVAQSTPPTVQSAQSGATLEETVQWLTSKIDTYAGGVTLDYDSGWQDILTLNYTPSGEYRRITKHIERTSVRAIYGPQACVVHVSWHKSYLRKSIRDDDPGTQQIETDLLMDLPLYDLKAASVQPSSDYLGAKVVTLAFNGKKAVEHVHGQSQDSDKGDQRLDTDLASDSEVIPFQRDTTQDNVELEGRVATAFNHLRDLCASQKPKSNEPF